MTAIDLRSDTVTTPTAEMRRAMADAEVGDDVYGEDPTVNRLQSLAASLLGKEAALYVPSGTMANQLAHPRARADRYRGAVPGPRARVPLRSGGRAGEQRRADAPAVGSAGRHRPRDRRSRAITSRGPTLLVLENTYMALSGAPIGADEMATLCGIARTGGLRVHVDGARIWNAAVALGVAPRELVAPADTVMFCLSKGLERAGRLAAVRSGGRDRARRGHIGRAGAVACARPV